MGWSCAAAAGDTLRALDRVCLEQTGMQNCYLGTDGSEFMYEVSRTEHADGAITGSVWRLVVMDESDSKGAVAAGNFRIAGDGKITRWPTKFPRAYDAEFRRAVA